MPVPRVAAYTVPGAKGSTARPWTTCWPDMPTLAGLHCPRALDLNTPALAVPAYTAEGETATASASDANIPTLAEDQPRAPFVVLNTPAVVPANTVDGLAGS